jgi:hypothetical protein
MHAGRRTLLSSGLGLLMGVAIAIGGSGVIAQDATPITDDMLTVSSRPAHVHVGTCETLGEVVAPLTDLTLAGGGTGSDEAIAPTGAVPAEYSFSTVPLTIDDMLASDHAINVHFSPENIGTYIACGTIGGSVDSNGSLVIGLRELSQSGYTGIAVLSPSGTVEGSTDISVFIANGLAENAGELAAPEAGVADQGTPDLGIPEVPTPALDASPEATPGAGT